MNLFGLEQNIRHFEEMLRSDISPELRATVEDLLRREKLQLKAFVGSSATWDEDRPPTDRPQ